MPVVGLNGYRWCYVVLDTDGFVFFYLQHFVYYAVVII